MNLHNTLQYNAIHTRIYIYIYISCTDFVFQVDTVISNLAVKRASEFLIRVDTEQSGMQRVSPGTVLSQMLQCCMGISRPALHSVAGLTKARRWILKNYNEWWLWCFQSARPGIMTLCRPSSKNSMSKSHFFLLTAVSRSFLCCREIGSLPFETAPNNL